MRGISHRYAGACIAAVIVAGCGASTAPRQSTGRVEPASSGSGYDFRKEGQIPAAAGGTARPETDVEEIALTDSSQIEVAEADAPPVAPAPAPSAAVVDGFRIQVFASADRDVAQNARTVAADRLRLAAYLDLEGGVYKVRVGDFPRREDANAAISAVRGHYPDAWVVPARVNAGSQ